MAIYATSDLHLNHNKSFIYEDRGFSSIEEHNQEIIKRWNSVITNEDDVYVLGDLMLGDLEAGKECLRQLNGKIHIVTGNHCTNNRIKAYWVMPNVVEVCECATMLKYKKWHFYLSHYPTITTNHDDDKPLGARVWNLCGHCHTQDKWLHIENGSYHVEVDAHNCYPILLDNIIEEIKEKVTYEDKG